MNEYRITDGKTIIIEMAATEHLALGAAARRLECEERVLFVLSIKKRPVGYYPNRTQKGKR